jgi:hypothetical protein
MGCCNNVRLRLFVVTICLEQLIMVDISHMCFFGSRRAIIFFIYNFHFFIYWIDEKIMDLFIG